jgi:hypothetical protein
LVYQWHPLIRTLVQVAGGPILVGDLLIDTSTDKTYILANYATTQWQASTTFALGDTIIDSNGNLQTVTTAGQSGSSEPTWALFSTTSDNEVVWTVGQGFVLIAIGVGGSETLAGLNDVSLTSLTDGQVLTYDSGVWRNETSVATLATLRDVALTSLLDGQVLTYNSSTGKWTNEAGDNTFPLTAGAALTKGLALSVHADGLAYPASTLTATDSGCVVGVATADTSMGSTVHVKQVGLFSSSNYSFTIGAQIFLGNAGQLIMGQAPGALFRQSMGVATSLTSLVIEIGQNPIPATSVLYDNPSYPTVEAALNALLYVPIAISFTNNLGTVEVGQSITTCSLSWTLNKTIVSQSIDQGIGPLGTSVRSYLVTFSPPQITNITWTLTVNDGTHSASASTGLSFLNKVYWGVSANTSLSTAQILALGSSAFASSFQRSMSYNCSSVAYPYYCYPQTFGLPSNVTVGGLAFSDYTAVSQSFTNASGHTSNYYVIRFNNIQTGSNISVSWA